MSQHLSKKLTELSEHHPIPLSTARVLNLNLLLNGFISPEGTVQIVLMKQREIRSVVSPFCGGNVAQAY